MRLMLSVALLLSCGTAAAGVVLEMAERDLAREAAPVGVQRLSFQDGQFRVDEVAEGAERSSVIFRDRTLYAIEHGEKRYTVVDPATLEATARRIGELRSAMQRQMANLPPEQRAAIEQMLAEQGLSQTASEPQPVERSAVRTSRTERVAERECRIWEVARAGRKVQELCVAAPQALPDGEALFAAMREMATMSRNFVEKIGGGEALNDAWADLERVNGIPILARGFERGVAVDETRLTRVREEKIGAAVFEVPRGYREQKIDLGGE